MHSLQQLLFAQHFPFTEAARKIVLEENPSLENLPEPLLERAELMARHAFSGKKYAFELHSADLLLQEILAFPIAKIIISFAGEPWLCRAFASMVADSAFFFLNSEKDKGKAAIELASELSLKFDFPEAFLSEEKPLRKVCEKAPSARKPWEKWQRCCAAKPSFRSCPISSCAALFFPCPAQAGGCKAF